MVNMRAVVALALAVSVGAFGLAGCSSGGTDDAANSAEEGSAQVEAPAEEEEEPQAAAGLGGEHDYECEYFYVDVPDSWVYDEGEPVEGGPTVWSVTQSGNAYVFRRSVCIGTDNEGNKEFTTGVLEVRVGVNPTGDHTYYGDAVGGVPIYITEVSASFLACDTFSEGATLTLIQDEADAADNASSEDEAGSVEQLAFIETARAALHVPDDPSITCEVGEPYYWEGAAVYVTPITFYQDGQVVAGADCADDGTPQHSILAYTAPE